MSVCFLFGWTDPLNMAFNFTCGSNFLGRDKHHQKRWTHTLTHTCTLQYQEMRNSPPNKKQDRAAKLPARFGRRDGLDGERGTTLEKGLWVLEGAAARQEDETPWGKKTKTRKKSGSWQRSINSSWRIRLQRRAKALRGELGATRRTRHGHERGREEAFTQKGFPSQKSLTVKSRKCKLLFTLEM